MYAEVILPLPLYTSYTYEVPDTLLPVANPGCRVLVQFGRSKIYTGIIESLHTRRPSEFEPKEIICMLDTEPVLRHPQLKLWHWISDYYICAPGEVMKAALPAALKIESETWVEVCEDAPPEELEKLSGNQSEVLAYVAHEKRVRISQIESATKIKNLRPLINRMIEKGIIGISERVSDKYVSKKVLMVSLTCDRDDTDKLHEFFSACARSQRREKLLVAYLDLSGWLRKGAEVKPVSRGELLDKSGESPAVLKGLIDKGILRVYKQEINRFLPPMTDRPLPLPTLSQAQEGALRNLRREMQSHLVTLLRGVTGAGKTEIYSHLIKESLEHGDNVLFLVPEISLTTQLTTRLQKIFGKKLLVYHSKFSDNERVDIWRRLLTSHEPMLVLGVRSSVFLPFSRLGLVIVDEEHESSYKQYDPAPRYNARDTAIMLASMHGAKVILGSATPSIETYYKAKDGKYGLVELLTRFGDVQLPQVVIADMASLRKRKEVQGVFSSPLLQELALTHKQGNQSILFRNRRGYAPMVVCSQCGWTPKCENCDVSLVYHRNTGELRCHYCGYSLTLPKVCPACGENSISTFGYGTERVADSLQEIFPEMRVARMDLDTTRNKDGYQEIISDFSNHNTDVLVGTQMVSKGLDFDKVKLVGILNADTMLNFPDFRSDERAFNMMEQVAGRAGRHGAGGKVIIQTSDPDNQVIARVVKHDYEGFYNSEIEKRSQLLYPPFSRVMNIVLRHKDERRLIELVVAYTKRLRAVFGSRVLGPQTPLVSRVSNYYIRTLMLKVEAQASMAKVKKLLRQIEVQMASEPGVKQLLLHYDVDPV